jgi:hypothetical protein
MIFSTTYFSMVIESGKTLETGNLRMFNWKKYFYSLLNLKEFIFATFRDLDGVNAPTPKSLNVK